MLNKFRRMDEQSENFKKNRNYFKNQTELNDNLNKNTSKDICSILGDTEGQISELKE